MDIILLAKKNLSNLQGYIDFKHQGLRITDDLILDSRLLSENEKVIGFYINRSLERNAIVITDQKMIVYDHNLHSDIKYSDIENCYTEPDKNSTKIFIERKDGILNIISVDGVKEGKFFDIYGFLRFIKKVLINIKLTQTISLQA